MQGEGAEPKTPDVESAAPLTHNLTLMFTVDNEDLDSAGDQLRAHLEWD